MISEHHLSSEDTLSISKNILVISNVPRTLAEIKKELFRQYGISIAATEEIALAALEADGADAVLICIDKHGSGMIPTAFSKVCPYAAQRGIPVLFLAEQDNEEDEAAAFAMGAADYSMKRNPGGHSLINRLQLRIRAAEWERLHTGSETYPSAQEAAPEALLANKTILIAEDIPLNREIIGMMLADVAGLTLEFACDGREAVEKFRENAGRYSLILMDIQMPEMNGLEAAKAIRSLNSKNALEIPIIALTADTGEKDIRALLEAGMNSYLEKPMDYESFVGICAKYCVSGSY